MTEPQVIDGRYIDREKLKGLLNDQFGEGNFRIRMQLNRWILTAPKYLTEDEIECCCPDIKPQTYKVAWRSGGELAGRDNDGGLRSDANPKSSSGKGQEHCQAKKLSTGPVKGAV